MTQPVFVSRLVNIHTHQLNNGDALAVVSVDVSQPISSLTADCAESTAYSIGMHPLSLTASSTFERHFFDDLRDRFPVLAIGEIGLDKYAAVDVSFQLRLFRAQVAYAREHRLPVIIHCVGCWNELEQLFKERLPDDPVWIIHGFRKIHLAEKFLQLGAYFGVGAAIQYNEAFRNCVKGIPLKRLFAETDAADVRVEAVYTALASLKSLPLPAIKEQLYTNFLAVFHHGKLA